jgi:hypothetical protein
MHTAATGGYWSWAGKDDAGHHSDPKAAGTQSKKGERLYLYNKGRPGGA